MGVGQQLRNGWVSMAGFYTHIPSTKKIGNDFIKQNDFLVLKVPSAVIQGEYNFLINPNHKDFKKVRIKSVELFEFDKRLFDR